MSRFANLHPYPAMIAEPLAEELAQKFVRGKMRVLDPFCGTARTLLAAAERGATCIGIDVNPLAVLVARAKVAELRVSRLRSLLHRFLAVRETSERFELSPTRKVVWIKAANRRQLCALIDAINGISVRHGELLMLAAILSATVREVSLVRKDCWKLHRLPERKRRKVRVNAIAVFCRRLDAVIHELERGCGAHSSVKVTMGDSRILEKVLPGTVGQRKFDLVITSPPYGDSFSTVQYGGVSGLCLGVLRHLRRLDVPIRSSAHIDRTCLGGCNEPQEWADLDLSPYWHGGTRNGARSRVAAFLGDMRTCCLQIATVLRRKGRAVFVIARRRVGGWTLRLDRFLVDVFRSCGIRLNAIMIRRIRGKLIPHRICRSGVSDSRRNKGAGVITIREEHVMVFSRSFALA